ncbi:MAG TPA: Rieske (2Fe-2S) protein [Terrimesophilobacter sp.]|nr:Rieske (2Fe-2S) protein [Terrimesophilobacter sp.]
MTSTAPTGLSRRSFITNGGVAALAAGTLALSACSAEPPEPADRTGGLPPGTIVAPLAQLELGGTAAVTVEGVGMLLARTGESSVVAFSSVCTHQGCAVEATFKCPCHGSRFDPETGENLAGPAKLPLPVIEVAVVDGNVVIA